MLKYKDRFDKIKDTDLYILRGATMLVEVLPKEELKTSGGIIIAKGEMQRATADDFRRGVGVVLMVGDGYTDGSEMEIKEGMVILLPFNPMYLSEFPGLTDYTQNSLAIVNEGDVLFAYKSLDDYNKAKELMNGTPKT